MRNSLQYFFDLAAKVADAKDDGRSFKLGAVGYRKDGVIVASPNAPCPVPERQAHAEYRVAKKLDYSSVVYIVRILRANGSRALARPCPDCQRMLISKRVKKVYYTIDEYSYGCWHPQTNQDSYYRI